MRYRLATSSTGRNIHGSAVHIASADLLSASIFKEISFSKEILPLNSTVEKENLRKRKNLRKSKEIKAFFENLHRSTLMQKKFSLFSQILSKFTKLFTDYVTMLTVFSQKSVLNFFLTFSKTSERFLSDRI